MAAADASKPQIGLYGLAVMGQNLALNIADNGIPIAVCNRSKDKVCDPALAHKRPVAGRCR